MFHEFLCEVCADNIVMWALLLPWLLVAASSASPQHASTVVDAPLHFPITFRDGEVAGEGQVLSWRPELVVRNPGAPSVEHASVLIHFRAKKGGHDIIFFGDSKSRPGAIDAVGLSLAHVRMRNPAGAGAEVNCTTTRIFLNRAAHISEPGNMLRVVCPHPTPRDERAWFQLRASGESNFEIRGQVEAMNKLPTGVELSACSKGIYQPKGSNGTVFSERVLQWSFYHRALGVQRLYVPDQERFFQEAEYNPCEAFVYNDWAYKGPGLFFNDENSENRKVVDNDIKARLNFCMHEYYSDDFILMELSYDEFLVCPSQSFVCPHGGHKKIYCYGNTNFAKACEEGCDKVSVPQRGASSLLNSTLNPILHPSVSVLTKCVLWHILNPFPASPGLL
jgi:hypothetical protein